MAVGTLNEKSGCLHGLLSQLLRIAAGTNPGFHSWENNFYPFAIGSESEHGPTCFAQNNSGRFSRTAVDQLPVTEMLGHDVTMQERWLIGRLLADGLGPSWEHLLRSKILSSSGHM